MTVSLIVKIIINFILKLFPVTSMIGELLNSFCNVALAFTDRIDDIVFRPVHMTTASGSVHSVDVAHCIAESGDECLFLLTFALS